MPMSRRSGASVVTSTPSNRIAPVSGSTKPAIERKVVVLPQPLGPSSETSSPSAISRLRSSTATNSPYRLVRPLIVNVVTGSAVELRESRHFLVPTIDDRVAVLVGRFPVEDDDVFHPLIAEWDQRLQVIGDRHGLATWGHVKILHPCELNVRPQEEVDPLVALSFLLAAFQHVEHLIEHEAAFGRRVHRELGTFTF